MWQQPKTNWDTHPKAIEPADLNRIEGNIEAVREQSNMALRLETVSSFPAHTLGRVIYHTGNKRAYVSDGAQWIPIGVEGDAVVANVLAGKKFSSLAAGVGATGTMPNRTGHVTAQGSSISGTTLRFRPQPGYYPGDAGNSVQLSDADFIAANIRNGKNIFGVTGTYTGYSLKASTNLRLSADNERSTQNTTPIKLKEITMGVGGTVRVTHRLRLNGGGYRVRSQVYLNGAPIGQDHDAGSTWETKTDALLFCAPGDKLQLYAWTQNSSDTAYVDNFRVYYNEVTDTEHFINLD